jgi:nucleotide-binding universal stress UspA family protein
MQPQPGTVLIAYDGSDDAAAAIRHAGSVLGARPAVVVHVWESLAGLLLHTDVDGLTDSMRDAAEELDQEDRRNGERIATEGEELARQAGFDAEAHATQGKPKAWPVLLKVAEKIDAAAIVIGSRGLGCVKSALMGSVSSGLLHHADRPVLVVPPSADEVGTGPVLIAFDGSDAARAAVAVAAELFAGREASVETVWVPYAPVASAGTAGMPTAVTSHAVEELDESIATRAEDTAAEGARLAAQSGLEARSTALEANGPAWATIRDSAARQDSPAIVVGSRGRGALAEAVVGSTSSALVHHSHVPILVVPPRRG